MERVLRSCPVPGIHTHIYTNTLKSVASVHIRRVQQITSLPTDANEICIARRKRVAEPRVAGIKREQGEREREGERERDGARAMSVLKGLAGLERKP